MQIKSKTHKLHADGDQQIRGEMLLHQGLPLLGVKRAICFSPPGGNLKYAYTK